MWAAAVIWSKQSNTRESPDPPEDPGKICQPHRGRSPESARPLDLSRGQRIQTDPGGGGPENGLPGRVGSRSGSRLVLGWVPGVPGRRTGFRVLPIHYDFLSKCPLWRYLICSLNNMACRQGIRGTRLAILRFRLTPSLADRKPAPNCPGGRPGQFGTGMWSAQATSTAEIVPNRSPKIASLVLRKSGRQSI